MHKKTKKQIRAFVKAVKAAYGEKDIYTLQEFMDIYNKTPDEYPSTTTLFYKTKFNVGHNQFNLKGKKPPKQKPSNVIPKDIKNDPVKLFKFLFDES